MLAALAGAVNAALAVIAAAFGAHGLEMRLAKEDITLRQFKAFETGAEHHLYHAIALVLVGLASDRWMVGRNGSLKLAAWLFLTGILLFSGSLYLYGLFGTKSLVWLTPIGGVANILGWLALAFGLFQASQKPVVG